MAGYTATMVAQEVDLSLPLPSSPITDYRTLPSARIPENDAQLGSSVFDNSVKNSFDSQQKAEEIAHQAAQVAIAQQGTVSYVFRNAHNGDVDEESLRTSGNERSLASSFAEDSNLSSVAISIAQEALAASERARQRRRIARRSLATISKGNLLAPDARKTLWLNDELKHGSQYTYEEYVARAEKELDSNDLALIESDSKRFPEMLLTAFDGTQTFSHEVLSEQIHRILLAACCRKMDPQPKYTQGMNYLVAMLLAQGGGLSEEEAFWTFCHMMQNVYPRDFFAEYPRLQGFHVYTAVFGQLVLERMEKLRIHLTPQDIRNTTSLLSFKWFITCFVGNMPLQISVRIWDLIFSSPVEESYLVPLRVALACLQLAERRLPDLSHADGPSVFAFLLSFTAASEHITADSLIKTTLSVSLTTESTRLLRATVRSCMRRPHEASRLTGLCSISRGHFLVMRSEYAKLVSTSKDKERKTIGAVELKDIDFVSPVDHQESVGPSRGDVLNSNHTRHEDDYEEPALRHRSHTVSSVIPPKRSVFGRDLINWQTFQSLVETIMPMWPKEDARKLFKLFDKESSKAVSFRSLLTAMSTLCSGTLEQRLKLCFDLYADRVNQRLSFPDLLSMSETLFTLVRTEPLDDLPEEEGEREETADEDSAEKQPNDGKLPFPHQSPHSPVTQHVGNQRHSLSGFPRTAASLVDSMLLAPLEKRPSSAYGQTKVPVSAPLSSLQIDQQKKEQNMLYTSDAFSFVTKASQMFGCVSISFEDWKECALTEQDILQCFQLETEYQIDTATLDEHHQRGHNLSFDFRERQSSRYTNLRASLQANAFAVLPKVKQVVNHAISRLSNGSIPVAAPFATANGEWKVSRKPSDDEEESAQEEYMDGDTDDENDAPPGDYRLVPLTCSQCIIS